MIINFDFRFPSFMMILYLIIKFWTILILSSISFLNKKIDYYKLITFFKTAINFYINIFVNDL